MNRRILSIASIAVLLMGVLSGSASADAFSLSELYNVDQLDYSQPPPDKDYPEDTRYPGDWAVYLKDQYVICGAHVVCMSAATPGYDRWLYFDEVNTVGYYWLWQDYLADPNSNPEKDILNIEDIDFTGIPPGYYPGADYLDIDIGTGSDKYRNLWLRYYKTKTLMWGDWIIELACPPPGYSLETDPWVIYGWSEGYLKERCQKFGYGDRWTRFFYENPDVLYLN